MTAFEGHYHAPSAAAPDNGCPMSDFPQSKINVAPHRMGQIHSVDPRVARTRIELMGAFTAILFAKGYEATTVQQITQRANVARSTFYDHFTSKADILRACMAQFFSVYADCVDAGSPPERLPDVLRHLYENRRLTDAIFTGPPRKALSRGLREMMEPKLKLMRAGTRSASVIPTSLAAVQLAESQLSLTEAWLRGLARCEPDKLADALFASTRAAALTLTGADC